ncbi:hypothetical protein Pyrde_0095 [Pyrodictium delaneyi]|uniref:Uncharacterized protein n=1 Tax=Pyrodictium delaneyi TaxID=1273541 RepID=A0A0N7JCR7_9CREN|nr:DUF5658 family protein [Pyrodictium delaneyi]ALL00145.1 hypothetical protein Pyrde_0095 [Pyrodictium delaneyi]OWJ54235.1 hypothetical protein Pdsh_07020 [Pyrodictium delaneyi]
MLESLVAGTLAYLFLRRDVPSTLIPYLASFAAFLDQVTTVAAISLGAHETNPFVRLFLASPTLFFALSAAKILVAWHIARRSPRLGLWLALVFLAAAAINAHNAYALYNNTSTIELGGHTLQVYIADTERERECGYYCYDHPAIAFIWPGGTPPEVTFTMEGLDYPLLLVHVRDCTVIDVLEMQPGEKYRIDNVGPQDWFIEVKNASLEIEPGENVWGLVCEG